MLLKLLPLLGGSGVVAAWVVSAGLVTELALGDIFAITAAPSVIGLAMWNRLNKQIDDLRRDMREDIRGVHERIDGVE